MIQAYEIRRKNIYDYIKRIKPELTITLVELKDPYGPTITRPEVQALVVSQ